MMGRFYLEGPHEVMFGLDDLNNAGLRTAVASDFNNGECTAPRGTVWSAIQDIIGLRNNTHHFKPITSKEIMSNLKVAHTLAVMFRDEVRSVKIRQLRDDLRKEANWQYTDIVANEVPAMAPDYVWAMHHQRFFEYVVYETSFTNPTWLSTPDTAVFDRAARLWDTRYRRPGVPR
ncbi:hypothetical protein LTR08_003592 [Meristemomyces frigidus]|nr:hypothetical protein LTR08_003592 [Meristemomyces frigidus]